MAAMMFIATSLSAQKGGFKGTIKFENSYEGDIDAALLARMPKELEVQICGNFTKMSPYNGVTLLYNGNLKTSYTLFDFPMGSYYIATPKDSTEAKRKNLKYDYEYTSETKTFAGYQCKKVLITVTDLETDEVTTQELWVSEEFNSNPDINFSSFPGLKGYPLALTQSQKMPDGSEIVVKTQAVSVIENKKLKEQEFYLTTRYQKVTYEELLKKLGVSGGNDD